MFLKTFGCACWPHLRLYNAQKLQFRSKQCVFLEYSSFHKGYKYIDLSTGRVYISCDVVFNEDVFPFSKLSPSTAPRLKANPIVLPSSIEMSNGQLFNEYYDLLPSVSSNACLQHEQDSDVICAAPMTVSDDSQQYIAGSEQSINMAAFEAVVVNESAAVTSKTAAMAVSTGQIALNSRLVT